ncbi:archease [Candidatus Woesearchaeota archaeon]|nr:archease [Candidatus Woesearchaeota archaeon]
MEKYRFIDNITSDVVFEAYGQTLKDVFINAAEAMFSVICKLDRVQPRDERRIDVEADSVEDLMVNWLQSLIASVDIEEMFFSKFTITEIDESHLTAFVYGQPVAPELGETVVKAVTYHQFEFKKTEEGYVCRVSLDI